MAKLKIYEYPHPILKQKAVAMVEARRRDNYVLREIIKWRVLRPIEKNPHLYEKFQRSTSKRSKISFDRDLYCGHVIGSHVDIKQTSESASIVYAHTASCGASWVCPVCAAKIHARRTNERFDSRRKWYKVFSIRRNHCSGYRIRRTNICFG